jgi:predicted alpha/beta-fold hydrolase
LLRKAGLLAILIGGVGSVFLTLYTGRRNPSALLMAAFAIWVLLPFVALAAADAMSTNWSAVTRTVLYALMFVTAIDTLGTYGYVAFGPPRPQPAFWFLVVPPASLLLIAILLRIVAGIGKSRS